MVCQKKHYGMPTSKPAQPTMFVLRASGECTIAYETSICSSIRKKKKHDFEIAKAGAD